MLIFNIPILASKILFRNY